jgi:hypothetical protein
MKSCIPSGAAALFILSSVLFAADGAKVPQQPGQLAGNSISPPPSANSLAPITIANTEDPHDRMMDRLWIGSMAAVVAGTAADAASSWGKLESNSLLASSNGAFGAKGLALKGAFAAAIIVPEIFLRKHKELRTSFIVGNFGEASIFGGAVIHNLSIKTVTVK